MNKNTFDFSVFEGKPEIYRETAILISGSEKFDDKERRKWLELVSILPENLIKKIHDFFLKEKKEIKEFNNKILEISGNLPPEDCKKIQAKQLNETLKAYKSKETASIIFDHHEVKKIEKEIEEVFG